MKILHISTSDRGGAGIAAVRLHEALLRRGMESKLLTLIKHDTDIEEHYEYKSSDVAILPLVAKVMVFVDRVLKRLGLRSDFYRTYRKRQLAGRPSGYDAFSFAVSKQRLERHPLIMEADIVHLHWVCDGFLDFKRFFTKVSKNIVWTLHDMNPFTGGCHHADSCSGYKTDCSECPQLQGTPDEAMAKKMLLVKTDVLAERKDTMTIVTPSEWLMRCSECSAAFKRFQHKHIYNVIDDTTYYVTQQQSSRKLLSLPEDKKIILCVAHDVGNPRKGYDVMTKALECMHSEGVLLCTVGSVAQEWLGNPRIHQLGYIMESSKMREAYNAADVFVLPSMAENFPNTIVESQLCGTPVLAFGVGGIPEQINDLNGVIVPHRNAECLAESLDQFFGRIDIYDRHAIAGEAKEKYASSKSVNAHEELYRSLAGV